MKKKRRYLKDVISVNINRLGLETGYFEIHVRQSKGLAGQLTYP